MSMKPTDIDFRFHASRDPIVREARLEDLLLYPRLQNSCTTRPDPAKCINSLDT